MQTKWPIIEVNAQSPTSLPTPHPTNETAYYMLSEVYYLWNDQGPLVGLAMRCTALSPTGTEAKRLQINVPSHKRESEYFIAKPVWLDALFEPFDQGRLIEPSPGRRQPHLETRDLDRSLRAGPVRVVLRNGPR